MREVPRYTSAMHVKQVRQGIVIGVLLVVVFWLGSLIWGLLWKAEIAVTQANETRKQYESLEARKATLQANLAALATPRGADAAIRTAFGVARPGEEVIVVVPPSTTTPPVVPPWWQQVFGWFLR